MPRPNDAAVSLQRSASNWLQSRWYGQRDPGLLLRSLESIFRKAVTLRQAAYLGGKKPIERLPVPVIVVGNLTVGGTGKTPLTLWLADFLKQQGYRPGIVSRGYGGRKHRQPLIVGTDATAEEAGDEPVLMAHHSGCPVCVFPQRAEAARALLAATDCNLILADDGLQHYALGRDIEIAVVDGVRGFGNGHCLPAGPLREPPERLASVDLVVHSGTGPAGSLVMTLLGDTAVNLLDPGQRRPLASFAGQRAHAIAGIGHPQRFFEHLREYGLTLEPRVFPDHHAYRRDDLAFAGTASVLMTEKDAVKCQGFSAPNLWYVPVAARLPAGFGEQLLTQLRTKTHGQETA